MLPFSAFDKSCSVPQRYWYPQNPKTIGEHIRKIRMDKKLSQNDVAKLINVSMNCVTYWENGRSMPRIEFMPAIIKFLGYLPIEIDTSTLGGRILLYRYQHGLNHKKLGKVLGVDSSRISCWERNLSTPMENNLEKLCDFF